MSLHRYPPHTLAGDYLRAGLGVMLTVPPLILYAPSTAIGGMLAAIGALCGYFLLRTAERHRTLVSLEDERITVNGLRAASIEWIDLKEVKLAYYTVKRDRTDGWMQLTLHDGRQTVKLDSRLDGFLSIVRRAARAARENDVNMNSVTRANLAALRITGE